MWKSILQYSSTFLFIVLWGYAAAVKLADLDKFHGQMAQSPLILSMAGWLKWVVPLSEILLAILLMFSPTRRWGQIGSIFLMACFCWYILAITHFSPYIPCSCGGILEQLSWHHHLLFNTTFVALGGAALLWPPENTPTNHYVRIAIPGVR